MNLQISLVHCVFLWLRYTIYCTQIILWIEQPGHFTRFPDGVAQTHVQVNDGIRKMALRQKARIFDIGNRSWIDIDDEAAFNKAQTLLAHNAFNQ